MARSLQRLLPLPLLVSLAPLAPLLPERSTDLLWPMGAPGAKGTADADKPSLTLFPAPVKGRVPTGIIVCPGGSYLNLSVTKEGTDVAAWLNKMGISAFVLKYRLGPAYHHPAELQDAQRAIRYVRAHADDYGLKRNQIGIWGFSAGGHLASTAGTHFATVDARDPGVSDPIEKQSSRPDFLILAYPVITMQDPYAHGRSRTALLGEKPSPQLIDDLSNELQVTAQTPPTFLFHTTDDAVVPVENSVRFYLALRRAGVPAELHVYRKGQHGVGLATQDPVLHTWTDRLADWLTAQGLR